VALQEVGDEAGRRAAQDDRNLLLVLRRRNDDRVLQLEVADQPLLELDAACELRIQRDADEAVMARVDQDPVDAQPGGAEAAGNLRLRPGNPSLRGRSGKKFSPRSAIR
jgi:hypothetical protein